MILVIGGIVEARHLCERLNRTCPVTLSVATAYGAQLAEQGNYPVICGKKDAAGFRELIRELDAALVIDCSHPFAQEVSREIGEASRMEEVPLLRYVRRSDPYEGRRIHSVDNFPEAARLAAELCGDRMVFLTVGTNQLGNFTAVLPPHRLVARVLDQPASREQCRACGIPENQVLAKCGTFTLEENLEDFRRFPVGAVVSKDSGAQGGTPEKIAAAEQLGLPTILIVPPRYEGTFFESLDEVEKAALALLEDIREQGRSAL